MMPTYDPTISRNPFALDSEPGVHFSAPLPRSAEDLACASDKKLGSLLGGSSLAIAESSSIMKPKFPQLLEHATPYLQANRQKLWVPASCVLELKKLSRADYKSPEQQQAAKHRLHLLAKAKEDELVDVLGSPDDPVFADPVLTSQIITLRHRVDSILVITNDYDLGRILLDSTVPDSGTIRVYQLNRYGYLSSHPSERFRDGHKNPFHA